jgi:hypothetical protein
MKKKDEKAKGRRGEEKMATSNKQQATGRQAMRKNGERTKGRKGEGGEIQGTGMTSACDACA